MRNKSCLLAKARWPIFLLFLTLLSRQTFGQNNEITVTGKIRSDSAELPGVSVVLKTDPRRATATDAKGGYTLKVPANGTLIISHVGFEPQEVQINGNSVISITLKRSDGKLNDVVVVAYGTQKKATLVSSITSINPSEIKGPTSNLTTMLAGRIPGLISFQTSGEPGKDNASFFIRGLGTFGAGKVDPLILIDGIESNATDLARLQPDNISGFSILKDATATSVYGARGANGVILVTTKTGQTGAMKFNIRVENSVSSNTKDIGLANNIDFMNLANEAVLTRNPLGATLYSQNQIDHTIHGDDPLLYPNNNWIQQLIKTATVNQRADANISGGTEKARYYLALSYNLDNGNLKENSLNGFSNNIKLQSYSILSNVTLNLTRNTEALISLKGQFDDYHGPIGGGSQVYYSALFSNPVAFPAIYPASYLPYAKHPLFGNTVIPGSATQLYTNPYAQSLSGYQSTNTSTMTAQFSLKQNLSMITTGLSARAMAYTTRFANFAVTRQASPYYYGSSIVGGKMAGIYLINDGSPGNPFPVPTEYLTYNGGNDTVNSTFYGEAAINYNRILGNKHSIGLMAIGTLRNYLTGNASTLQLSLPARNEGVSGRATYGYDDRYLLEFDFGYNGSERFAANHRFGFFPSVGGGWVVSREKFFEPLTKAVDNLKFRFTYGLVGNDQIGNANDRFFYLSEVGLNGAAAGGFGTNFNYTTATVNTSRYANPDITWEQSKQLNVGMDLTLLRDIKVTVDAYHQKRTNILMYRYTIPSTMGLQATPAANVGQASSKGIDIAVDYTKTLEKDWWVTARGTFTYATSKVLVNEEPIYAENNKNLSHVGQSLNALYGLIAERLFVDQVEVNNSPSQFGNVLAGDIKYRDVTRDGKISTDDYVRMGFPYVPEIQYGFGFSVGYKHFDISAFFQGSARVSFMIDPIKISPFAGQHGLLDVIAKSHWSEDNRNSYAFWPRLNINSDFAGTPPNFTDESAPTYNDNFPSSWWLRSGAFMRLKSAEVGYNFSASSLKRLHLGSARIYMNGINLLTFSAFKTWDPEMGSSGLGYPIQKVVNAGILLGF